MDNHQALGTLLGITAAIAAGVGAFLLQDRVTWRYFHRANAFPNDDSPFRGCLTAGGALGFIALMGMLAFIITRESVVELASRLGAEFDPALSAYFGLKDQYVSLYSPFAGILTVGFTLIVAFGVTYLGILIAQGNRPDWLSEALKAQGRSKEGIRARLLVAIPVSVVAAWLVYESVFP